VVNGSEPCTYDTLRWRHPYVRWQFHEQSLGFGAAIEAGLEEARFDWV
jgi:hypothetical protein